PRRVGGASAGGGREEETPGDPTPAGPGRGPGPFPLRSTRAAPNTPTQPPSSAVHRVPGPAARAVTDVGFGHQPLGSRPPASRGRSSEPIAAGLRTDVSQRSRGIAFRAGPQGRAGVPADTSPTGDLLA